MMAFIFSFSLIFSSMSFRFIENRTTPVNPEQQQKLMIMLMFLAANVLRTQLWLILNRRSRQSRILCVKLPNISLGGLYRYVHKLELFSVQFFTSLEWERNWRKKPMRLCYVRSSIFGDILFWVLVFNNVAEWTQKKSTKN